MVFVANTFDAKQRFDAQLQLLIVSTSTTVDIDVLIQTSWFINKEYISLLLVKCKYLTV